MSRILEFFFAAYSETPLWVIVLEAIAFITGILSVLFAKKENILVYPVGLIATIITTYLLWRVGYLGDMMINIYYSIMSVYGWWNWSRKKQNRHLIRISRINKSEMLIGLLLCGVTMLLTYAVYMSFNYDLEKANYIDILTSGIFFTGMWYMANKKIENWTLWIIGDLITVPLYAYRGLGMLSLQYLIFTFLAVQGYIQWKKVLNNSPQPV